VLNANSAAPQATGDAPQLWVSAPTAEILADSYGTVGSYIVGRAARGTAAAPTALQANDALVGFGGEGRAPSGYNADAGGLTLYAAENWTATANGTLLILATVTAGTTTNMSRVLVGPGMQVCTAAGGSPTGGDKGPGTINTAAGYYVNGGGSAGVALVASGNSYINGGNVGIGTAAPAGKLTVSGAGQQTASINTAGSLAGYTVHDDTTAGVNSGGGIIFSASNQAWKFASIQVLTQDGSANSAGHLSFSTRRNATDAALTQTAQFAQNGSCINASATWLAFSDARIKSDVRPYERGLSAILALNPVSFVYNERSPFYSSDEPRRHGLVAQEVAPHVPEAVGKYVIHGEDFKKTGELLTLDPGHLTYVLINAVRELAARLERVERRK
jgi:hypothetical protein